MGRTKAYIKGLTSTAVQKILTRIIGLAVVPIVISYLGKDDYGIWIVIGSFLGYMGLMDFGITGSVTQLVAKSNQIQNVHKINTIVNNSFFLQVIVGSLIILLGIIFSYFFPEWFEVNPDSKETVWMAFLLASIGYGISFPPKTLQGLIIGKQHISLSIWLDFFIYILTTGLNLWMLDLGFGLLALPIGTIIVRLLSYFIFFKMAKKVFPKLHLDIKYFNWSEAKNILGVSSVWFIGAMSAAIIYSSDTIIVGSVIGAGTVTVYVLTYRLTEFFRHFIYMIGATAMPGIGQLAGEREIQKIRNVFFTMFPLIMNLTFSAVLFLFLFNDEFVSLWVGAEFYGGDDLSAIFALTLLTTVVFHSFSIILSSGLNLKVIAISRSIEAVLNIILSLWFIKDLGIIGVALGTVISHVVTSFWVVPYFASKYLNISVGDVFRLIGINIGIPLSIYIILYYWVYNHLDDFQINNFFLLGIWVLLTITMIWLFGLPISLKEKYMKKLNNYYNHRLK